MDTPRNLDTVKRIVLIRLGKIGDLIVSNFAFRKVRVSFPDATILLVTLPRNRELLRYNHSADRVLYFHKGMDILRLSIRLRMFKPDLFLDFNDNSSGTSSFLARFCTAPVKVGFAFPGNRPYLSHPVECPAKDKTHITERLRRIPEAIGLTFAPEEVVPSMELGPQEANEVRHRLEAAGGKSLRLVSVNLSAGHASRYWQTGRWCQLLAEIATVGPPTLFILLTAHGEENLASKVSGQLPSLRFFCPGRVGFHHFAAFIARSGLLLSPDTSAIHIAASFRVPVIGLYPAVEWNYESWRPVGTASVAVRPAKGDVGDIGVHDVMEAYRSLESRLR
jgi:ADP-heptose:LPS heptosyltransferase